MTPDPSQPVQWEVDGLGLTHYDDFGCRWIVTGTTGWRGTPARRTSRRARINQHGSYRGAAYVGDRIITITGVCKAPDAYQRVAAEIRIGEVLSDPRVLGVAKRTAEDHYPKVAYVELDDGIDPVPSGSDRWFDWDLQLAAPDPRIFEANWVQTSGPLLVPGSGGVDATAPGANATGGLSAGTPSQPGIVVAHGAGNADIGPVLKINGPVVDPTVLDTVSGFRLVYTGTIESGHSVWINCDDLPAHDVAGVGPLPGHSVLMDGYSSRRANLAIWGSWPKVPGGGQLSLLFSGTSAGSPSLDVYHRSAWR